MARRRSQRAPARAATPAEATTRDYVMARLAAARLSARAAIEAIDDTIGMFMVPDDDTKGDRRAEALGEALEQAGCATRALECAEEVLPAADFQEIEPWDEEHDDDER